MSGHLPIAVIDGRGERSVCDDSNVQPLPSEVPALRSEAPEPTRPVDAELHVTVMNAMEYRPNGMFTTRAKECQLLLRISG
jgi:hypothetical protein